MTAAGHARSPACEDGGRRLAAIAALAGGRVTEGNAAAVLHGGDAAFDALLTAIGEAQSFVALSAHVFWGDIAADVTHAIAARAAGGLPCFVLPDGLQSLKTDAALLDRLRRAGARVARGRRPWRHPLELNRRMHRNLFVADGALALVGGVGIADDWRPARRPRPFRDTDLVLRGPVVGDVLAAFLDEWLEANGELPPDVPVVPEQPPARAGDVPMVALRSRAETGTSALERALRLTFAAARSEVDIATAYFVPPRRIREALAAAAGRGVRVRLLVPGRWSNRPASRRAGEAFYGELLEAGVGVYEYRPTMLHTKVLVVDGCLSAVGSANLDNRSLRLDDELVAFAADAALAAELGAAFEDDLSASARIELRAWRRRPVRRRAVSRAALLVRRDL
jgi:cardiolipin synthase